MNVSSILTKLSIFVPELKPMIPAIISAIATAEKVQAIIQPALDRLEAGEVALIEAAEAAPALEAILPEIDTAIKAGQRIADLVNSYEAKLNI